MAVDKTISQAEGMAAQTVDANKELATFVLEWFNELKSARQPKEGVWTEVQRLMRPNSPFFAGDSRPKTWMNNREGIYDDFPIQAGQVASAGICSNTINPSTRWFGLTTGDIDLDQDQLAAAWLEKVSNLIFDALYEPETAFGTSTDEFVQEAIYFGTAPLMVTVDSLSGTFHTRAIPLAECYIAENSKQIVDVLFRYFPMTRRQGEEMFPDTWPKVTNDKRKSEETFFVIHAVYPNKDKKVAKFQSIYLHEDKKTVLEDGTFADFPYCVFRWSKKAGETYGTGPGIDQLQNVRVLNECARLLLQGSQLAIAPPMAVDDDSVIGKVTWEPYEIVSVTPGSRPPTAIDFKTDIPITLEVIQRWEGQIGKAFYNDLLATPNYGNRERVTAQEVLSNRDERLRQLAPVLNRLEVELLNPLIQKVYGLLKDSKKLPKMPQSLMKPDVKLKLDYLSPAAQARRSVKSQRNLAFLQTMIPFTQQMPGLLDPINTDEVVKEAGFGFDISRPAVRSDDDVAKIRAKRAQDAQAQAEQQQALNTSEAIKNVAGVGPMAASLSGLQPQT